MGLAKARKDDVAIVRLLLAYGMPFARVNCLWLTAEDLRPSVRREAYALVKQACHRSFPRSSRKGASDKGRHKERRRGLARGHKRSGKSETLVKSDSSTFSCDLERTSSTVSNRASREKEVSAGNGKRAVVSGNGERAVVISVLFSIKACWRDEITTDGTELKF